MDIILEALRELNKEESIDESASKGALESDIALIEKEFNIIRMEDGEDVDDEGMRYEYYAICINGNLRRDFDDLIKKLDRMQNKFKYFDGYDFNLDRGFYFGHLANPKNNELEIRFYKGL